MSGPKTTTVRYVPTEQERRAANERQLAAVEHKLRAEAARAQQLAAAWAERAPDTARELARFTVSQVQRGATGDLSGEVRAGSAELARTRQAIDGIVARCVAEEVRRLQRQAADEAVVARAQAVASRLSDGRSVERTIVDLGEEKVVDLSIEARASVQPPEAAVRITRVESILARGDGTVAQDEVAALLTKAVAAEDVVAYDAVRQAARAAVDQASAAAAAATADRERARGLLAELGELEGAAADDWRRRLEQVLVGERSLPLSAPTEVAAVVAEATTERLLDVMRGLGYEGLDAAADGATVVGWLDHGAGTGTQVRVDAKGVIMTPAASRELDAAAARRVDEVNCRAFEELAGAASSEGLELGVIRRAAVGEVPLRILGPLATAESETTHVETRQVDTPPVETTDAAKGEARRDAARERARKRKQAERRSSS